MTMRLMNCLMAAVFLGAAADATANQRLFDFETRNAAEEWQDSSEVRIEAETTGRFASTGRRSLRLTFPGFESGKPKKRGIEAPTPVADFDAFNWMITDVTNPSERDITMQGQVFADGDDKNTKYFRYVVPAMTTQRIVHGLNFGGRDVAKNIDTLRLFVEDFDSEPSTLYIDNIILLDDKKKPSDDPSSRLQDEIDEELQRAAAGHVEKARRQLGELGLSPALNAAGRKEIDRIDQLLREFGRADLTEKMQAYWGSQYLARMLDRLPQLEAYGAELASLGKGEGGVAIGFASSMKKVMPRHLPVDLEVSPSYELAAAQHERESFQIAVAPLQRDLRDVKISVGPLAGEGGRTLSADAIDVELVAFTQTIQKPGYKVDYVGWWPDPIIADPRPVDVVVGEVQPWWVRVRVPRDQAPGRYTGSITVEATGMSAVSFDLAVQVHGFAVPPHTPLPTAINYLHNKKEAFIDRPYIGGWDRWHGGLKFDHADFLADYYITLDSIYRFPGGKDEPSGLDMEIIEHLREQNRLGPFCIGYYFSDQPEKLNEFREYYEQVKAAGLENYTYIYGYDEQGKWSHPLIANAGKWFRENFPGTLSLTTAGVPLDLPGLEGHIPINAAYYRDRADDARTQLGKQVWWYTCVWPPHPYPNLFLEYQPMDTRVLMGAMTAFNQPDGFLYYSTSWFNDNTGIDEYPYTDWDPVTFPNSHGDGRILYIDPEGQLISSMVLENYRDGLEDLAYHMILQHQLNLYEQSKDGWLRLVRDGDRFTGYRSADGNRWEKIHEVQVSMGQEVYIGLASSAHNKNVDGRVVFDQIHTVGGSGGTWQSQDIGKVAAPGSSTIDPGAGRITIRDRGPNIWYDADSMHYAYRSLNGDGAIQVRVAELDHVDGWVKSGVMIRESLEPGAANAFVALTPEHGTIMQARRETGRNTGDKIEPKESSWAGAARSALEDVKQIASGRTTYDEDPELLLQYRRRLAKLIESSPIQDTNPWVDGIPVRGVGVYR